jgi:hypothetical protein
MKRQEAVVTSGSWRQISVEDAQQHLQVPFMQCNKLSVEASKIPPRLNLPSANWKPLNSVICLVPYESSYLAYVT